MSMQRNKVEQLKEIWGDKPCDHPKIQKEYEHKSLTGNIVCLQCGRTIYNSAKHPPLIIGMEIQKGISKQTQ
jgi:hypothetical protein